MQTQESPPQPPKTRRPRYLTKRLWLLGLVGVIVIATLAGCGGGTDDDKSSAAPGSVTQDTNASATTGSDVKLFPQPEDKETSLGQSVEIAGSTATVTALAFRQSISERKKDGYIVAGVSIRSDSATGSETSYNLADNWKLQTPSGRVLDPIVGANDLTISQLPFEVGAEKGDFYLIYKTERDSARGIWKVTR
jgi:hypothetical protein